MLTRRKEQFAGAAFFLALALALWGCVGTINHRHRRKRASRIRDQPANQTVTVGQTAMFSVNGDRDRAVHLPVAEEQR